MGAGASHWADAALLLLQLNGWETDCGCASQDYERFRVVIDPGEAFLTKHPRSRAWTAVALTVARAHETAWSWSRGGSGEMQVDRWKYVLEAPRHRQRAMALYEATLARAPSRFPLEAIRQHHRRLELEIDTGSRTYMHFCD